MHNPGFADISLDHSLLLQLPENDTVFDKLTTIETPETGSAVPQGPNGRDDDEDAGFDTGTVPHTRPTRTEAEDLQEGELGQQFFLARTNRHRRQSATSGSHSCHRVATATDTSILSAKPRAAHLLPRFPNAVSTR